MVAQNSVRKRDTKCPNCRSLDHEVVDECPYVHWKCRDPFIPNNPFGHNACVTNKYARLYLRGIRDIGYLHVCLKKIGEAPAVPTEKSLLPPGINEAAARFKALANQNKTSMKFDRSICAKAKSYYHHLEDNEPIVVTLPDWTAVYNLPSSIDLYERFFKVKTQAIEHMCFISNSLVLRRHIDFVGGRVQITHKFTFETKAESKEFRDLWFNLGHEDVVLMNLSIGQKYRLSNIRIQPEGRDHFVFSTRSEFPDLAFGANGYLLANEYKLISFSFETDLRTINKQIDLCNAFMRVKREDHKIGYLHDFARHFDHQLIVTPSGILNANDNQPIGILFDVFVREVMGNGFEMSASQRQYCMNGISRQVTLVKGPPGTGKTAITVLLVLFQAIYLKRSIKILTKQNVAADDIAESIVRVFNTMSDGFLKHYDINERESFVLRKAHVNYNLNNINVNASFKSRDEHFLIQGGQSLRNRIRILITTAGHSLSTDVKSYKSDMLIVEEAGMIGTTELFSVFSAAYGLNDDASKFTNNGIHSFDQLILIGDTQQMLPRLENTDVFTDQMLSDAGLDMSALLLFSRNAQISDANAICTLDRCYRGPHALYSFLFGKFYLDEHIEFFGRERSVYFGGQRIGYNSCFNKLHGRHVQLVYADGPEYSHSSNGHSRKNYAFMAEVIKMIRDLQNNAVIVEQGRPALRIALSMISYITFYKGQWLLARLQMDEAGFINANGVKILTVDQAQGHENDIIILDITRSGKSSGFLDGIDQDKLGFFHAGRTIVGLTRARICLIVVGHTKLMSPKGVMYKLGRDIVLAARNANGFIHHVKFQ